MNQDTDGKWVATAAHNSPDEFGAKIWNANTGELVHKLKIPGFCWCRFSSDGRWLLTSGGVIRFWEVGTWKEHLKLSGSAIGAFSPTCQLYARESSEMGAIDILEADTGRQLLRLIAPDRSRIMPIAFSPDACKLLCVCHEQGFLHIWDLEKLQRQLKTLNLDWSFNDDMKPTTKLSKQIQVTIMDNSP